MLSKSKIIQYNKQQTDPKYSKMTFGMYRGWFLKDIPLEYLIWGTINITDRALATYFSQEILRRDPKLSKSKKIVNRPSFTGTDKD